MCEYLVHYMYVVCSARIALSLMEFNIILVFCCVVHRDCHTREGPGPPR